MIKLGLEARKSHHIWNWLLLLSSELSILHSCFPKPCLIFTLNRAHWTSHICLLSPQFLYGPMRNSFVNVTRVFQTSPVHAYKGGCISFNVCTMMLWTLTHMKATPHLPFWCSSPSLLATHLSAPLLPQPPASSGPSPTRPPSTTFYRLVLWNP